MAPAAGWAQATLGLMRYGQGRPDEAARAYATAFDLLVTHGQTLWATVCAVNLAFVHEDLRDHEAALAWAQRGLGVARATGAAIPTGLALVVLGERLRRLAQWEPARAALDEAQLLLQPIRSARNNEQGALDAAQGMFASALTHFEEARSRAMDLGDDYLLVTALLGMAEASLGLQDAPAAGRAAQAGLEAAQRARRPSAEAEALAVLARCQAAR
jgi:tetratricopeptide (TPR) repeat protein